MNIPSPSPAWRTKGGRREYSYQLACFQTTGRSRLAPYRYVQRVVIQSGQSGSFSENTSNVGVQARVPLGVPLRRGVDSVGHEALVDAPSAVDESPAAVDEADFELRRGALDEHL